MGLQVDEWPAGLGADASGVVVEVGPVAAKKYDLKAGDYVCGCTRVGPRQYSTCREFFLMDAQVAMRKPSNLSVAQAATIGSAAQTACFGIFAGLEISEPDLNSSVSSDGWILVLGGSGSVGRAAVQLARAAGFKVIASCSEKNAQAVKHIGATAVFDYRLPIEEQVAAVKDATRGVDITKILDATSADDPKLAKALFQAHDGKKLFSTTNSWSKIGNFEGGKTFEIELGRLGRPDSQEINDAIEKWNPMLTKMYEAEILKPMDYEQVGSGGLEDALRAYKKTSYGRKVVIKIDDE